MRMEIMGKVCPRLPCLLLLTITICCVSLVTRVGANDTLPLAFPRNGTTRSPFHPTFAPGPASTPVVQHPPLARRPSSSSSSSFPPSLVLGSRFLSFLRSVRGTLEDVVSGVDPGVTRVLYQEKTSTSSSTTAGDPADKEASRRVAEIILRKSSILTGGGSRIIACRIHSSGQRLADSSLSPPNLESGKKHKLTRRVISNKEFANLVKNCGDINRMKPYMIPTLKTEQELLSDKKSGDEEGIERQKKRANGTHVTSGSSLSARKSPAPGGEEEKNGVFDGVAIYPGTKWCGAGDIASHDQDLGHEKEADACCRDHDKCPDAIPSGETKYNLTNGASYTKSACECDQQFYHCLQKAGTFAGDQIGRLYFNVLQIQCFRDDYPIVRCIDQKGFLLNRVHRSCQEYELDHSKPKVTQFFDPPFYSGVSGPLFNIPVVSDILQKPVSSIKDSTINGGVIGNVVAG